MRPEETLTITNAQYNQGLDGSNCSIACTINGEDWVIPLDANNDFYAEIMRQVNAGTLTIQDAD